jgi:hypothetical protein
MLTPTLRALGRDGLVSRTVHATVPPRVDYAPTSWAARCSSRLRPCTTGRWRTATTSGWPAPATTGRAISRENREPAAEIDAMTC